MNNLKNLILFIPAYVIAIIITSSLWEEPIILTFLYIVISCILLLILQSKIDTILFCVAAFLGPLAEVILISNGAWSYSHPLFLIPIWLPFAWGIASVIIKRTSDMFLDIKIELQKTN